MKKFFLLALLIFSPSSALGLPASEAKNSALKYEAYWNGIKIMEIRLFLNEQVSNYNYQALIDTKGIFRQISKYWSVNTAKGRILSDKYLPASFETKFQPKKSPTQRIIVNYATNGLVSETAAPPEDRGRRPVVTQEDKQNIPDPVTAVGIARQKVSEIISANPKLPQIFNIRTFDARRVFDLNFAIIGYEKRKLGGKTQQLLRITLTRTPVAGFSEKELAKEKKERPAFDIYVDSNFIPIVLYGNSSLGKATISLAKSCSGADCKL